MKYKIFVVSIKRNLSRQQDLVKHLTREGFIENDDFLIVNGLDYKQVPRSDMQLIKSKWARFTPAPVLACAYSHFNVWKLITEQYSDLDFAIILEDDAYLLREEFFKYRDMIHETLQNNKNYFLNNSTDFSFFKGKKDVNNFKNEAHFSFAMNTYFIHPQLATKLFDYFKTNKFSYHIDLHLGFIKEDIGMKIFVLVPTLFRSINKSQSSMIQNHKKKYILGSLLERKGIFSSPYFEETYKNINTPVVQTDQDSFSITAYIVFVFVFFIIILMFTYFYYGLITVNNYWFTLSSLLWVILGMLLYDIF